MRIWLCCLANGVAIILCKFSVIPMWINCYYFKSLERIWEQRSTWTVCCVLVALQMSAATAWMVLSPDPAAGNARCWQAAVLIARSPLAGSWSQASLGIEPMLCRAECGILSRLTYFYLIGNFMEREGEKEIFHSLVHSPDGCEHQSLADPNPGARSSELLTGRCSLLLLQAQQAAGSEVQQPGPGLGILWDASDAGRVLACCCAGSKNVEF